MDHRLTAEKEIAAGLSGFWAQFSQTMAFATQVCTAVRLREMPSPRSNRRARAVLALATSLLAGCGASVNERSAAAALRIVTASLPNGQASAAYSATLAASGGTAPYTWMLTGGTLPAGLSLSAGGAITGIPTATATATALTLTVRDAANPAQTATAHFTLAISAPSVTPLAVASRTLPNGQVGAAYSATLTATGGTPPYTWMLTGGRFPTGLSMSATGAITGTPTETAVAVPLTFTVADGSNPAVTATAGLALTVNAANVTPLAITTTSLPNGQVGAAYSATLAATGGTAPYTWTLSTGTLPAGLTLNATTGAITGTPTASASATPLSFTATDAGVPAQAAITNLTLTVAAAATPTLAITTTSLASGRVGTAYSATLAASGGTSPYTWTLTGGTLPAGLMLNATTGAITGTPTALATATPLTFKVTDAASPAQSTTASLALTIAPATLAITTTSLASGTVGMAYSATLAASGGTSPYTWTLTGGTLPAGLTLNATTGAITGTPTASANATPLTFKVTDAASPAQSTTASLALTIAPATLAITTTSLASGIVGTAYSATLAASGGTSPYTWTLTGGTLPAGLTLNATTGAITGTPTATATATPLTFTVKDAGTPQQTKQATLNLTIAAGLSITSTSLPDGTVGTAYSATLAASGGTSPYTWTLTGGTLPAGLTLNATTGAITGTPTATTTATALVFTVQDAEVPSQRKTVNVSLTIAPSGITVSLSPKRAGIVTGQALAVTATINDPAGVSWSAVAGSGTSCSGTGCGTFSSTKTLSGVAVTYTAPDAGGFYTLTATSVTDSGQSASITVDVTDLAGVATYHNNLSRNGANTQEYALTPSNVNASSFGKLFSCTVDGVIYAQPLWVPNVTISGAKHNVIFVATQNDSIYAFDADTNTSPCTPLWKASLLDSAHGAGTGEVPVPAASTGNYVGSGYGDVSPEVGVLGTPVIDLSTGTLYAVSKTVVTSGPTFYQRLHALDITSGDERFSGPATIAATYPGTGDGGTTTTFNPRTENQRAGLALVNGVVYIAWASHEDTAPYYGWVIGYNASNVTQQVAALNISPNAGWSGIWMSGGAPAADSAGNLYMLTGNGVFDAASSSAPNNDYGDSFLKVSTVGGSLNVSQYFGPSDQETDKNMDGDFGSGGATVLIDLPANGTNPTHLVLGGGKDHSLYVLNRDAMGGVGDSNAWQLLTMPGGIFSTGAFWNSTFYIATAHGAMQAYTLDPGTAQFTLAPNAGSTTFGWPGISPSVSSMPDNTNGIVWGLETHLYCTTQSAGCSAAVLHAYDASNLSTELWNSSQGPGNAAGYAVKFTVPTVANGKVYVGTRGNNTGGADSSTSTPGELDVYGLLPN